MVTNRRLKCLEARQTNREIQLPFDIGVAIPLKILTENVKMERLSALIYSSFFF